MGVGFYVIKYFTTFFASKIFFYFPPLKPRCVLWSEKYGNFPLDHHIFLVKSLTECSWYIKYCRYIRNVHNWMSLDLHKHLWNHLHKPGCRHIHHLQTLPCVLCVGVCVVRTQHEIYPLNRLWGAPYGTVNHRHYVVQRISRTYSSCMTESLHPLVSNSPLSPPLSPWPPPSYSISWRFRVTCEWNHVASAFPRLACFT